MSEMLFPNFPSIGTGPGGIRYGKQYRARCDYGFDNNKSRMVNSSSDMVEKTNRGGKFSVARSLSSFERAN